MGLSLLLIGIDLMTWTNTMHYGDAGRILALLGTNLCLGALIVFFVLVSVNTLNNYMKDDKSVNWDIFKF